MNPFIRLRVMPLLLPFAVLCAAAVMTACGSDDPTSPGVSNTGLAYIRAINSLYQTRHTIVHLSSPIRDTVIIDTVPVPVDFFVNASTALPGMANMPANSITVGDSANGYAPVAPGVTSFNARVAGDSRTDRYVFTAYGTDQPFVPKVNLTSNRYQTVILAGIIPDSGNIPGGTISFNLMDDDQFGGALFQGVAQARFILLNAAPRAGDDYLRYYLTQGTISGSILDDYSPSGIYTYLGCPFGCNYKDVAPGTYTLTVAQQFGSTILGQQSVTFAAGEVVTAVLQSTSGTGAPTSANHVLRIIHDHPSQ